MKKSKTPLSKIELAQQVGVNPNSIQKRRMIYRQQGIDGLYNPVIFIITNSGALFRQ